MSPQTYFDFGVGIMHDTRSQAAAAVAPLRPSMQRQVFDFVSSRGRHGATDHEIHVALRMAEGTARVRRVELVQAGVLAASDRTRPSPAGCPMTVWLWTGNPLD